MGKRVSCLHRAGGCVSHVQVWIPHLVEGPINSPQLELKYWDSWWSLKSRQQSGNWFSTASSFQPVTEVRYRDCWTSHLLHCDRQGYCTINMALPIDPMEEPRMYQQTLLQDGLYDLLESDMMVDCVLKIKDKEFPCHRLVWLLAARTSELSLSHGVEESKQKEIVLGGCGAWSHGDDLEVPLHLKHQCDGAKTYKTSLLWPTCFRFPRFSPYVSRSCKRDWVEQLFGDFSTRPDAGLSSSGLIGEELCLWDASS